MTEREIIKDQWRAALEMACACAFFATCAFFWIGTP